MYGTIARMKVKPGMEGRLAELTREYDELDIPGYHGTFVYRMDADPDEYYLVVLFDDRASYRANADDPAQHARYLEYRELLQAEPEWHDGEVVAGPGL